MSGHSKWSTIKRKKGVIDAKRGKIFSKLSKEIIIAAREGGGNAEMNARLRLAVNAAKAANMPKDNIERAIKRGTGEIDGVTYEDVVYEAYGPGGVAICIEVLTDNKNRTTPEIRHLLMCNNGSLTEPGAVLWMFDRMGYVVVDKDAIEEDDLFDLVIEAGADDIRTSDDIYEIYTPANDLAEVNDVLERHGLTPVQSEVALIPKSEVTLEGSDAKQILRLLEELDDHDDVQKVSANYDIADDIIEEIMADI